MWLFLILKTTNKNKQKLLFSQTSKGMSHTHTQVLHLTNSTPSVAFLGSWSTQGVKWPPSLKWEIHTPLTLTVWWKYVLLCQGVVLPKGCEYLVQHIDSLKRQFRESPPPPRTPVSPRSLDHLLTMAVLHYRSDPVVTWFPHAYPGHPESPGGPVQTDCCPRSPPKTVWFTWLEWTW